MRTILPVEMAFEITMVLYIKWKYIMIKYAQIYPGANFFEDVDKEIISVSNISENQVHLVTKYIIDQYVINTRYINLSTLESKKLLSKPIQTVIDAVNTLNPKLFFCFLEHIYRLIPKPNIYFDVMRDSENNIRILFNRFLYYKSQNKMQWLRDEMKHPIIFIKEIDSRTSYFVRCPGTNYLSTNYYRCFITDKYHMCHRNHFLRTLIQLIIDNTHMTQIDDSHVCMFIFQNLPHMIVIDKNHIEINNLYYHEKYDYPILRLVIWYLLIHSKMISEQTFMEHYFENLNRDLVENNFVTSSCANITEMITKSEDDINENSRLIMILLSVLRNGWYETKNGGFSYFIDPTSDENNKVVLENNNFYVENTYIYAEHIIEIFADFLKIIPNKN